MLECLAILAVGLIGGSIPLFAQWTDRRLHGALALSTGIFLGAVFLHLLPSLPGAGAGPIDPAHAGHDHGSSETLIVWACVLAGVLGVYLIESVVLRTGHGAHGHHHGPKDEHDHGTGPSPARADEHQHKAVGYAALLGLSLHSLLAGVGLSAAGTQGEVAGPVFVAVLSHKGFEAFSLATVFRLAAVPRGRIVTIVVLFSLVTPVGFLTAELLTKGIAPLGQAVLTAVAAGTFLYVSLCELLPEVFHHREEGPRNVAWLALGVALMAAVHAAGA